MLLFDELLDNESIINGKINNFVNYFCGYDSKLLSITDYYDLMGTKSRVLNVSRNKNDNRLYRLTIQKENFLIKEPVQKALKFLKI